MSQSRSQGRQVPTSSGSHPAVARAGGLDSASNSQHSQIIKNIENDIDSLIQEVDQLGKEFIASTKEYNSSLSRFRQVHRDARAQIITDYLAKMQDISLNSKPEDVKKQACEELEIAAKNKLGEIKGRIDDQANEFEAEGSEMSRFTAGKVLHRAKANAMRGNPQEIKKAAGTPEGMQAIEICRARLDNAYKLVENRARNSYQQYLEKMGNLKEQHEKIKETLDEANIREVPEDRAEAARRVSKLRSWDPKAYEEDIKNKNRDDKRMNLLKK